MRIIIKLLFCLICCLSATGTVIANDQPNFTFTSTKESIRFSLASFTPSDYVVDWVDGVKRNYSRNDAHIYSPPSYKAGALVKVYVDRLANVVIEGQQLTSLNMIIYDLDLRYFSCKGNLLTSLNLVVDRTMMTHMDCSDNHFSFSAFPKGMLQKMNQPAYYPHKKLKTVISSNNTIGLSDELKMFDSANKEQFTTYKWYKKRVINC